MFTVCRNGQASATPKIGFEKDENSIAAKIICEWGFGIEVDLRGPAAAAHLPAGRKEAVRITEAAKRKRSLEKIS